MSDFFESLIEDNGELEDIREVPPEMLSELEGRVPNLLIEIWKERGLGAWRKGRLRLCSPFDYADLQSLIFEKDPDLDKNAIHVFATTAFGELYCWSEEHFVLKVDLLSGEVRAPDLLYPEEKDSPELALLISIYDPDPGSLDCYDEDGKPLYSRAVKKLGPLAPGECFGFAPALAMGGTPSLENIRKFSALEHFAFLAQLQPFKLMDYLSRPIRMVRLIGPPS